MKRYIKHFILLAVMPLACFCTKNGEFTQPSSSGIVKISAGLPDTKVSLTPGTDPALALAWEETDEVVVEGTTSSTFTLSEIVNEHTAYFEGEEVSGSEFAVYYPSKDILTRSYEGQVQKGNASAAHLAYNAMVEGLSSYESFTFEKVNGAIKLVIKVPSSVTEVSSISITSLTSGGVDQTVFYKTNDAEGEKTATLSLGFTEGTAPADGVLTAYMMVSWNKVELAEGSRLAIKLTVPGRQCSYQKTIKVSTTTIVAGGQTFIIDLSDAKALKHVIAGSGTQAEPYLLYDAEDMLEIKDLLVAGSTTYFKMMDDIDMQGINWVPGNQTSPYNQHIDFNGNNMTIRNLTSITEGSYPGLIGVLSGRVANVTFEDPVVESNKAAGVICGYAGTSGTNPAIVENVNIINGQITQKGDDHTGLIFGHSNVAECEFTNITVSGTINQDGIGNSGFIGGAQNIGATFTNCHASGTLTVKSSLSATDDKKICSGGIQGYSGASTFDGCSFSGTIHGGRLCGGIVGYDATAGITVTDCHVYSSTIDVTKIGDAEGELVGGVIGWVEGGTVSDCSFNGNITAALNQVGGIAGYLKAGKIERCYSSGSVKGAGYIGGITGYVDAGTSESKNSVEYCYSTADVTGTAQMIGGVVGDLLPYSDMSYCFSTGAVKGARGVGGVVGRAASGSSDVSTASANNVLNSCHAYNSSITGTQTDEGYGSGTIAGFVIVNNTFTNCYRHPAFGNNDAGQTRFSCANEPNELPVDQGLNIDSSNPITAGIVGTTSAKGMLSMKYTYPFHGNVADNSYDTMTKLAKYLGWDTAVWDLTGNHPTLNRNPEPIE